MDGRSAGGYITELVRSATVVIASGPDEQHLLAEGSGFWVAPGRVLTCAHVVVGRAALWIQWQGQDFPARCLVAVPEQWAGAIAPAPDTAVLAVDTAGMHPVVPLADADPVEPDDLYVYGITKVRTGDPEPDGGTLIFGGRATRDNRLYKLQRGQIAQGQSGGPVLNLRTHQVCGMVKSTLDPNSNRGGHAVPIAEALAASEGLRAANLGCLGDSLPAVRAAQAALGTLPIAVAEALRRTGATAGIVRLLRDLDVECPAHVAASDLDEWAARQLFNCTLKELVDILTQSTVALGSSTAEVLHLVACCLPIGGDPPVWWVSSEAATALRAEWARGSPRVVRLNSDQVRTRHLLLRRATFRQVALLRDLPFSADTIDDGQQADIVAAIDAWLERDLNVPAGSWSTMKREILEFLPDGVLQLDGGVLADAGILGKLLVAFDGLRFIVCSRETPPPGAESVLLDLRPPIDPQHEKRALFQLGMVDRALAGPNTASSGGAAR